jgi:hypothetical protein
MSSVLLFMLHSMKLENPDNLMNLSIDFSEGTISNVLLPIPAVDTPISDAKYNEHSKSDLLLLIHLVIPTSFTPSSTPILKSVPVLCSALDVWP